MHAAATLEDMREKGEAQRAYYSLLHALTHQGLSGVLLKLDPVQVGSTLPVVVYFAPHCSTAYPATITSGVDDMPLMYRPEDSSTGMLHLHFYFDALGHAGKHSCGMPGSIQPSYTPCFSPSWRPCTGHYSLCGQFMCIS